MGKKRNAYELLEGKREERRQLGRPICRWVDNIEIDLGGIRFGCIYWITLAQDRDKQRAFENVVMNNRIS
jgi:hypothetical protein